VQRGRGHEPPVSAAPGTWGVLDGSATYRHADSGINHEDGAARRVDRRGGVANLDLFGDPAWQWGQAGSGS
jgi:hypothetical protein